MINRKVWLFASTSHDYCINIYIYIYIYIYNNIYSIYNMITEAEKLYTSTTIFLYYSKGVKMPARDGQSWPEHIINEAKIDTKIWERRNAVRK